MESTQITTARQQAPDKTTSIRMSACVLLLLSRQHLPLSSLSDQTGHTLPDWAPQPQTNGSTESHSSAPRGREETNEWKGGGAVWAPGSRQFVNERELQIAPTPSVTARLQTLQPTKHNADFTVVILHLGLRGSCTLTGRFVSTKCPGLCC